MEFKRFIDVKDEKMETSYSAGRVEEYGDGYTIGYYQQGAAETFSIGQPVYDKEGFLMGYLAIGLFRSLTYALDLAIPIPVEQWVICLPTADCKPGKKVYTYYQECERMKKESERNEKTN